MFAVTTCLPPRSARSRYSRAGSIPPITSTSRSELGEDLLEVAARARQHAADHRPPAVEALDLAGALVEQRRERAADRAVAEQADLERARATALAAPASPRAPQPTSRAVRSSKRSRLTTTRASPSLQKITGGRGTPL